MDQQSTHFQNKVYFVEALSPETIETKEEWGSCWHAHISLYKAVEKQKVLRGTSGFEEDVLTIGVYG